MLPCTFHSDAEFRRIRLIEQQKQQNQWCDAWPKYPFRNSTRDHYSGIRINPHKQKYPNISTTGGIICWKSGALQNSTIAQTEKNQS